MTIEIEIGTQKDIEKRIVTENHGQDDIVHGAVLLMKVSFACFYLSLGFGQVDQFDLYFL